MSQDSQGPQAPGQEQIAFGRLPLLPAEREYGTRGAHSTCFAYAIATWCFLTGGFVAELVGAVQGAACLIAGSAIGVFLTTMPLSLGCHRNGLEQMDVCKPSFGQRGTKILVVMYLINMLGWSGLILVMFGNGIKNIAIAIGFQPGGWIVGAGVALGLGLAYLIATRGVHLLNISNSILTPGIALLLAYMFYVLFHDYGWEVIASAPPLDPGPKPLVNYLIAVELGVAGGFSWWGGIGFLTRNTRSRRNAVYPEIIQLGFAGGAACTIGLFSALVVQTDDPTEWMVPIGGVIVGVIALLFVALANVTSTAVSIFASGLALRHVPALRTRPWWQLMALLIVPCLPFVFWPGELYDLGPAFLAYNGTMYAPISGIVFVDFFFLRGQRLNLWSIFEDASSGDYHYTRGFNLLALGSLIFGQVIYIYLYNPITGEVDERFVFAPASLFAFFSAGIVYWVGMRLLAIRRKAGADSAIIAERSTGRHLITPNI